jgi:hypothetical protein
VTNRRSTLVACGAVAVALMLATTAHGWIDERRINTLTFRGPVTLPGVSLEAGTYIFERGAVDERLVRVRSQDRSRLLYAGFTHTVRRPPGLGAESNVTFGEAPADTPPRITAWYPAGGPTGQQFIYSD